MEGQCFTLEKPVESQKSTQALDSSGYMKKVSLHFLHTYPPW